MRIDCWQITGGGFHFGQQGMGQEETWVAMPSDSLFSALLARTAELYGAEAAAEWVAPFVQGKPPFVLSSTFPFAGGVRFFPVPASALRSAGPPGRMKDLKRVAYVSAAMFRRLIAGESLAGVYAQATGLQDGAALAETGELAALPDRLLSDGGNLWFIGQRPRVTLDRASSASNIYQSGEVRFASGCGLWFGVHWLVDDPARVADLQELLTELGFAGLGGDRSAGLGGCAIQTMGEIELPDAGDACWVTLSRFLPGEDQMGALTDPRAAFRLVEVGGWLQSPRSTGQRRRMVRMLVEGSVCGPVGSAPPGCLVDVRPSYESDKDPMGHPVYRNGLALAVGLEGGEHGGL